MRIRVSYEFPPIPSRQFDWSAVDDSTYDGPPCPVGTGATKELALIDLLEQLDDYEAADEMRHELSLAYFEERTP